MTMISGWSQSGTLEPGNPFRSVSMQAQFPEPGNYTVQFGIDPSASVNNPVQTEALISWSVAGNTVRRLVSVANGLSVTGMAEAVRVEVKDATIDLGGGAVAGGEYGVSIQVSHGSRPSTQQPPTYAPLPLPDGHITVNAASSVTVPIPRDAGVISVMVTVVDPTGAATPLLDQQATVAQRTSGVTSKQYDPRNYTWVPISPGADEIELINRKPALGDQLQFFVTFGIDG